MQKVHYLHANLRSYDMLQLQILFEEKSFGATIEIVVHSQKRLQHLQSIMVGQEVYR